MTCNISMKKIRERLNDDKTQKILLITVVVTLGFAILSDMYKPYSDDENKKQIMKFVDDTSTKAANEAKKLGVNVDKKVACKEGLNKLGLKLNSNEEDIIVNFCVNKL
jgi:hypothetical protein